MFLPEVEGNPVKIIRDDCNKKVKNARRFRIDLKYGGGGWLRSSKVILLRIPRKEKQFILDITHPGFEIPLFPQHTPSITEQQTQREF